MLLILLAVPNLLTTTLLPRIPMVVMVVMLLPWNGRISIIVVQWV